MTTAFHYNPAYSQHTISGHPEHAGRLEAVYSYLQQTSLLDDVLHIENRIATRDELLLVHTRAHLDLLARTEQLDSPMMLGADTYVLPVSYALAKQAVGSTLNVVDAVITDKAANGLACVRPPGHHATPAQAMGFCLLSTVAIAAKYAIKTHNLKRVAIVDFDVHHGNGTQDCLFDDENILFISSHQSPLYPGTGYMHETGRGNGRGTTLNIPLKAATGDRGIIEVYEQVVLPALRRFKPELVIISAGFDAHWRDPLANLNVSLGGFAKLSLLLKNAADELCNGRVIAVTEGGYDLEVMRYGTTNMLRILKGQADEIEDPIGQINSDQTVDDLVAQLKSIHQLD